MALGIAVLIVIGIHAAREYRRLGHNR